MPFQREISRIFTRRIRLRQSSFATAASVSGSRFVAAARPRGTRYSSLEAPLQHPTITTTTTTITTTSSRFYSTTSTSTNYTSTMAGTPTVTDLNTMLSNLGLEEKITKFPDSNPESNPVDIFRCYIAEILSKVSGVDSALIYPALEWTNQFDKGDLILAVPRLRVKGKAPADLAKEWAEKVYIGVYPDAS